MVARAYTVAFQGVQARLVEVQCAIAPGLPAFAVVGLLGALTTFSTFSLETLLLIESGHVGRALANVALNVMTNYLNKVAGTAIDFPVVELQTAA